MNRMLRAALGAATCTLLATAASAGEENGGVPGEWLSGYGGGRTMGMGGAFVATADDALGALWNPAGLSQMFQNELLFENTRLHEDTGVHAFGFAVPGSRLPSFGLGIVSIGSSDFEKTNELNDPLGTFRNGETAFLFTIAKGLSPKLGIGTNVKVVRQTVEDFRGGGVGFDLGALYHLGPTVRVGVSVMNLGGPTVTLRDVKETWPIEYRGGLAWSALGGRGLVAIEIDQSSETGARLQGGTEYWIQPVLGLRVGFHEGRGAGGFSYRFAPSYQVDYAAADHPLGMTHRVGLAYRFGGFFASSRAEPEVFSPTGERSVTKIHLNARTKAEADRWTLEIVSKSDEVVRRFGGKGLPPAHIQWDGKDETGLPLADGVYRYRLEVHDQEGRRISGVTRRVEISTGGPQGSVPVIPIQ